MEVAVHVEESDRVYEWRVKRLMAGGFSPRNANILGLTTVDWHYAIRVLDDCKAKGYDEAFVMKLIK